MTQVILQAGQLALQGIHQRQQLDLAYKQLDMRQKQFEANAKAREEHLRLQQEIAAANQKIAQQKEKETEEWHDALKAEMGDKANFRKETLRLKEEAMKIRSGGGSGSLDLIRKARVVKDLHDQIEDMASSRDSVLIQYRGMKKRDYQRAIQMADKNISTQMNSFGEGPETAAAREEKKNLLSAYEDHINYLRKNTGMLRNEVIANNDDDLNTILKSAPAAQPNNTTPPAAPLGPTAQDDALRTGLESYFAGDNRFNPQTTLDTIKTQRMNLRANPSALRAHTVQLLNLMPGATPAEKTENARKLFKDIGE